MAEAVTVFSPNGRMRPSDLEPSIVDEQGEGAGCSRLTSFGSPTMCDVEALRRQLHDREAECQKLRSRLRAAAAMAGSEMGSTPQRAPPGGFKPLTIIIPMIGLGDSFAKAGYSQPRPLVNIVGRPILLWLLDNLTFNAQDVVYLVVPAMVERQHAIGKLVSSEFRTLNVTVVPMQFETRGWIETIFSVVRQMPGRELRMPLVTLDCSTIYHGVDLLAKVRELPEGAGASCYFDIASGTYLKDSGSVASQFSYIQLNPEGFISNIVEKQVISKMANTGAYIFRSGREFRSAAEQLLESPEAADSGGLYASCLIRAMIRDGQRFIAVRIGGEHLQILSTPSQLRVFTHRVSVGDVKMEKRMRFCFDLDGTLVTQPTDPTDFASCEPIPKAIALVRQLYAAGHVIVIVTSRGMHRGRGVGAAMADAGRATFAALSQFNIPYHELHFGKPHADVYIDAHTLHAHTDIERELGWCTSSGTPGAHGEDEALELAIDARAFNMVRARGKTHVIKSSRPDVLRGECHWYRFIPTDLQRYFPKVLEIVDGGGSLENDVAQSSITMERVSGVTFSHLVTARLLLRSHLRRLIRALRDVHAHAPVEGSQVALEEKVTVRELCANYASKVRRRIAKYTDLYSSLGEDSGIDTERMSKVVMEFLEEFEANERPIHAHYIHGDPVFSNVIYTPDDDIVFIDMRGELGTRLTTQGDVHYDLSKVYQSLCGYDFMLLDQVVDEASSEVFDGLRAAFWEELSELYPDVSHRHVRLHTAAHFFTIIPLHEVRSRMLRYLRTSFSMLSVEGLM